MSMTHDPIPDGDEAIVAEAKAEFEQFINAFQAKYGYTIGCAVDPRIDAQGHLVLDQYSLKLVKAPAQDGNSTTTEASPSDSPEQQSTEAA